MLSPQPEPTLTSVVHHEPHGPDAAVAYARHLAAEKASPLVRALLAYERHFCLHLAQARVIAQYGDARISASSRCQVVEQSSPRH